MQIACPKCGQTLKLGAVPGQKVAITCPKCSHAFQTMLPAAQSPDLPSAFDSPFDSLPPTPTYSPAARAATFRQTAAKPKRKTKPQNRKLLVAAGIAIAACLVIAVVGWVAWTKRDKLASAVGINDGDPEGQEASESSGSSGSFLGSLIPNAFRTDTPEIIFDEYFELQERMVVTQTSLKTYDEGELEVAREKISQANQESRDLLRRGLALPPCPVEMQEKFRSRYKAFLEQSSKRLKAHFASHAEAQQELAKKGVLGPGASQKIPFIIFVQGFLGRGFYEIEEQEAEQSKIYAREVDLLRRLNLFLAETDWDGVSSSSAAKFESFSDELIDLAVERSTAEGGGMFVERALGEAGETHRALATIYIAQISEVPDPDKDFVHAAEVFRASQKLFDRAKGYTPDEIRKEYADAKKLIKEPEMVAKKGTVDAKREPKPTRKPATEVQSKKKPQPAVTDVAQAETRPDKTSPDTRAEPTDQPRGFGGMPIGPGGFRSGGMRGGRGPVGPSSGGPSSGGPSFGGPPFGGPPRAGAGERFQPERIRSGAESRAGLESRMERFKGDSGATILFEQPKDPAATGKAWAKELGVNDFLVRFSSGKAQLVLRWTGSMESLSKKITFARVLETDDEKRQIRVEMIP